MSAATVVTRVLADIATLAAKSPEALGLVAKVVRAVVTGRDPVEIARRAVAAVVARKGAHAAADATLRAKAKLRR